jgi:hypothetical protein
VASFGILGQIRVISFLGRIPNETAHRVAISKHARTFRQNLTNVLVVVAENLLIEIEQSGKPGNLYLNSKKRMLKEREG